MLGKGEMMWGEFEDSPQKVSSEYLEEDEGESLHNRESPQPPNIEITDDSALSLRDRIVIHIASSSLTLKSQQRYEPDLTYEERVALAKELLDKPGSFLYRFGKHLHREHFPYFLKFEGDSEVDHYVAESLKHLNQHTAKIIVRNRRYAAMQELRRAGNYFSEKEMEKRDPLLYDQLIARHQSEEERKKNNDDGNVNGGEMTFSSLLLQHIDNCSEKNIKKQLELTEDEMVEEEETDEESEEEDDKMEDMAESGEKQLFREEFYSSLYHDFLRGKDSEFDYSQIDGSDNYDLVDIRARDEEERYFDEDDDEEPRYQDTR